MANEDNIHVQFSEEEKVPMSQFDRKAMRKELDQVS